MLFNTKLYNPAKQVEKLFKCDTFQFLKLLTQLCEKDWIVIFPVNELLDYFDVIQYKIICNYYK